MSGRPVGATALLNKPEGLLLDGFPNPAKGVSADQESEPYLQCELRD